MINKKSQIEKYNDLMEISGQIYPNRINDSDIFLLETFLDNQVPLFISNKNNEMFSNINNESDKKNIVKKVSKFDSNIYLYYYVDKKYYVDINHIISNLTNNDEEYKNVFREFSEYICQSIWTPKENGKFIKRELIDLQTMGRIILKFNGKFSSLFMYECMFHLIFLQCFLFCLFFTYMISTKF